MVIFLRPGQGRLRKVRECLEFRVGPSTEAPRREGEKLIRERGRGFTPRPLLFSSLIALLLVFASACGGGDDEAPAPTTQSPAQTAPEPTSIAVDEDAVEDEPFDLVVDGQAVPPDFRAAYERESPIAVQFYEQDEMAFYPQGLGVDTIVDDSIGQLQEQYPDVEFFSYDIDDPGASENSAELELGQYGTLATQLGVDLTPYVAMLTPREGEYVYESVFIGYVTQPVLEQALSDLANAQTTGTDEGAELVLEQAETAGGGQLQSVTIGNEGDIEVGIGDYELASVNPSTGEADVDSGSLSIDVDAPVESGASISLGRSPNVQDAEGDQVDGTFGGGSLGLQPGDQLALVGSDGAVVATFTF